MFLDLSGLSLATVVLCRPEKCSWIYPGFDGDGSKQRVTLDDIAKPRRLSFPEEFSEYSRSNLKMCELRKHIKGNRPLR